MLELDLELPLNGTLKHIQEEPALEIALPQVFAQPRLGPIQRGKLPYVEALIARLLRVHHANPGGALGTEYQGLVTEFQPLFDWAMSSWDFVLSREGCRFVPRHTELRIGIRGDYRVITSKDFSRIVHGIFRSCVLEFAQEPQAPLLAEWLRSRFWPRVLSTYRRLEQPADPRQRTLTPYSYLRCVPYQFLNDFHHDMVYATIRRLPGPEHRTIDAYFLHFYTEGASAIAVGRSLEDCRNLLRQGLSKLLVRDRLVYCLLRQIERY